MNTSPTSGRRARIGLLGGTFDPVHNGHLDIAESVHRRLELDYVAMIPAGRPVHRGAPRAGPADRLAMLRLAVAGHPNLRIDTREIDAPENNYTVLTLQALRRTLPQAALCWIVGEDAFAHLTHWYQWRRLFDLAHFIVIARRGSLASARVNAYNDALRREWDERRTDDIAVLDREPAGRIFHLPVPVHPASASAIRAALAAGRPETVADLLPAPVLTYIARHSLYQANFHDC